MSRPFRQVWAVVNGVNLLQGIGFLSRIRTRGMAVNHALGFGLEGAPFLQWIGAVVFLAFLLLMVRVDYLRPVEFRSPRRPGILVP
ncbi:MAG: hypothetical protein ACQERF_04760 [Actinomycetota bacterium]